MKEPAIAPAPPEIHRAEWVVPVCAPPVPNGAVLTHGGRIVDAGAFAAIMKTGPAGARVVDHGRAALLPALVNAHTHLELSALRGEMPLPQPGFRQWIALLLAARARMDPKSMREGAVNGEAELWAGGVGLCADITNGREEDPPPERPGGDRRPPAHGLERQIFLELLGFNVHCVAAAIPPGFKDSDAAFAIPVPHSVYSVSPEIIAESKRWTKERGLPYSIHAAEHLDEIEFLQDGKGFCRELLMSMGRWDPAWTPPRMTPVEYLDRLGALDSRTLLVHAVHMTEADWTLAAKRRCTAVFCPRSNRNLGTARPSIEKALSHGINCALGTDSLASNTDLNLFAEAAFALDDHPSIDPRRAIEMITVNPARSLGRQDDFGRIGRGAKALMLAVSAPPGVRDSSLAEALIQSGGEGAMEWVNCGRS